MSDQRIDHEPVVTIRLSPFYPVQYFQAQKFEIWVLDPSNATVTGWRPKVVGDVLSYLRELPL